MRILVTGATGYIGGRLVPELLAAGHEVTLLARHPERLAQRTWAGQVRIVRGDAVDAGALDQAMRGQEAAYYLLHSLNTGPDFEALEQRIARTFADAAGRAAAATGLRRVVYLGGMVPESGGGGLSPHLASRARVGEILRASGVPTIELRAGVIIGSGSASFEMLRYLTERLPVMVTPKWVSTRTQPIGVADVLFYLVAALDADPALTAAIDIGGPDVTTYAGMMQTYAQVAGLRPRRMLVVPWFTPSLSSHWVQVVTPVPNSIARPLVESLRVEVVCRDDSARRLLGTPPDGPMPLERALRLALQRVRDGQVRTTWASASVPGAPAEPLPRSLDAPARAGAPDPSAPGGPVTPNLGGPPAAPSDSYDGDPAWAGGSLYTDLRTAETASPIDAVWRVVARVGGDNGWFAADALWQVRGLMDRAVGGVGLRRGRRDPDELRVGDAVDFWRVEVCDAGRALRLRAEMKLPGRAWLEWRLEPAAGGGTHVTQRAVFYPRGLAGHAYWWSVYPFHAVVFPPMLRGLVRAAEENAQLSGGAAAGASMPTGSRGPVRGRRRAR